MEESQYEPEIQQKKVKVKVNVSTIFSKTTLDLLEFLVLKENIDFYGLTEIANILLISPSTVSKICHKLVKLKILIEKSYPKSFVGRPIKIVELNYRNPVTRELAVWIRNFSDYVNTEKKTNNIY